jgi:hypothetical protein
MKHLVFIFSIVMASAFVSCQKDYVCVCTNASTGHVSYGDNIKTNVFTKKAAEESCKANNDASGGSLKDCHLE